MELEHTLTKHTTELLLVRHGQTDWNVQKRIQGQLDVPLNAEGYKQAQAIAHQLSRHTFAALYSSDLARAAQTAESISLLIKKPIEWLPELREMHAGDAQGLLPSEREALEGQWQQRFVGLTSLTRSMIPEWPNGESRDEVLKRVHEGLATIVQKHTGQKILIVTHSGVIYTLLEQLGHAPVVVPNCSIVYFSYHHSSPESPLLFTKVECLQESSPMLVSSPQLEL